MKTRREFLSFTAGSLVFAHAAALLGAEKKEPWKIGITDWDLRTAGRLNSFAIAKELGYEGVQVSYQPDGAESLAIKANRPKFLAAAKEAGVGIASFCIGNLNQRPLATTKEAEGWVADCIDAMDEMNVDRVLLPFFGNADMNDRKEDQPLIIEKFKRLAPIAEKKKKILAIESYLSAEDVLKMIDSIGSDAVRVYYDVRNSMDKKYNIYGEIEQLVSKKMISEIHFKENKRLGEGDIDFAAVCAMLDKFNYTGWVVVESSVTGDWRESQAANAQFIKKLIAMFAMRH